MDKRTLTIVVLALMLFSLAGFGVYIAVKTGQNQSPTNTNANSGICCKGFTCNINGTTTSYGPDNNYQGGSCQQRISVVCSNGVVGGDGGSQCYLSSGSSTSTTTGLCTTGSQCTNSCNYPQSSYCESNGICDCQPPGYSANGNPCNGTFSDAKSICGNQGGTVCSPGSASCATQSAKGHCDSCENPTVFGCTVPSSSIQSSSIVSSSSSSISSSSSSSLSSSSSSSSSSSTPPAYGCINNACVIMVYGPYQESTCGGTFCITSSSSSSSVSSSSSSSSAPKCGGTCATQADCPTNNSCVGSVCKLNLCIKDPKSCTSNGCAPLPNTAIIDDKTDRILLGFLTIVLGILVVKYNLSNKALKYLLAIFDTDVKNDLELENSINDRNRTIKKSKREQKNFEEKLSDKLKDKIK